MAQSNVPRVTGGVYASIGGIFPLHTTESAGGYLEAARYRFRPGLELRATVDDSPVQRVILAGPRVAHSLIGRDGERDVYAAVLFGPSHILNATGTKQIPGVTSQVVLGGEKNLGTYVRWRIIEFSAGFFSGSSGLQTFDVSTGIVLHFH
jgi:hypothetical protein